MAANRAASRSGTRKRRKRRAGRARDRLQRRAGAVDDGDRRKLGDQSPAPPEMKLAQVVGAHDPDETDARRAAPEPRQRVIGVTRDSICASMSLTTTRGPTIEPARGLDARLKRRKPGQRFQRIARRHQPPDAVERESVQGEAGDQRVPLVGRIERAAEQADAHAGREAAAGAERASRGGLRGQQLRLALGGQRVDDLVEPVALHDPVERIEGEVDAVVGHPPLREIVGADALRAVAGADLRAPLLRAIGVELLVLRVEDARAQKRHRLGAVAVLRPLLLHRDHDAGRQVGDADRRFGLVDVLAARRRRSA